MQRRLLDRARDWVREGGVLVYSVCSLEPEEGEQAILDFLKENGDFHIEAAEGIADWLPSSPKGWVRILPGLLEEEGGLDGFFMARLVRSG